MSKLVICSLAKVDDDFQKRRFDALLVRGDKHTKTGYRVAATAGDWGIIRNFIEWLRIHYGIKRSKIKLRLHIWEGMDIEECQNWWRKQLKYDYQFTKPYVKPSGKNKKFEHGICRASFSSKEVLTDILKNIEMEFR